MLVRLGTIGNAASVSCTTPERGRSEEGVARRIQESQREVQF